MGILDTLKGAVGVSAKPQESITGEIERIGVLPGTDNASYVFRLKSRSKTYYVAGDELAFAEVRRSGQAIALTAPGDQVRFLYDEKRGRVTSFENVSYPG